MEVSGNESEVQLSFRSPPRRRRSTFFEKRDSIVPEPMMENINPNVCNKLNEMDEKHNQELKRYYDKLLAEKDQWKAEVKHRRNNYHDLRQQFQISSKTSSKSRISYSALSNEDIDFLNGKVNISQLVESQSNLHKNVRLTRELYRRAVQMDNVILDHCKERLKEVTDYILKNSTVEQQE